MKLLKTILAWLGISVEVEHAGTCIVCAHGPSPALGVPILTPDGTYKHLICMTVGRQIAQAVEQANAQESLAEVPGQQPTPVILTIVRPIGREVWN